MQEHLNFFISYCFMKRTHDPMIMNFFQLSGIIFIISGLNLKHLQSVLEYIKTWQLHGGFVRDCFCFFTITQWLHVYFSQCGNGCGILIYVRGHYRCSLRARPIIHCWEDGLNPSSQTSSYLAVPRAMKKKDQETLCRAEDREDVGESFV